MDHNEAAQSVAGLEQAEILEIIDHHRLADIQTGNPIYFRNEPVGSTTTIIAGMYQEKGLMPSEKLAGMMAAAIVSDTVMFKSPTCTQRDRNMAERMARIANVSLDELGQEIFSASWSDDKPARDLMFTDFKDFHIAGHNLGVGQITCVNSEHILRRKDEFLAEMEKTRKEKDYSLMLLMLTDVLLEGTQLIYLGDEETVRMAFSPEAKGNVVFLPGVMASKTINPTRMELTRLKGRLRTAVRGHRLLKDKRDELMRQFFLIVRENKALRAKVEAGIEEANRAMTDLAIATGLVYDDEGLFKELVDREEAAPTAVGMGAAFLHPRYHDPYFFEDTFIAYGRARRPVFFGAPDGEGTRHFFMICSTDHEKHLHILARLAVLAHGTDLLARLDAAEDADAALAAIRDCETEYLK